MKKYTYLDIAVFFTKTRYARTLSKSESEDKLREVHNIGGKENVTSILKHKDQQHHRLVRFTSIPGKMIVQLILGIISRNMKYKEVIRSQQAFTKGKSYSTNVITFYNEMPV